MKLFKKILKIIGYVLVVVVLAAIISYGVVYIKGYNNSKKNMALLGKEAPTIEQDGFKYRDLNKNGKLDTYEDFNALVNERVDDLLSQMNLDEKAGLMFITMINMNSEGKPIDIPVISTNMMQMAFSFMLPPASDMIVKKKMRSFNILSSYDAHIMATFNNTIQKIAERSRLGIPITLATDPRHGTENNPGASIYTSAFSQWPSSLGLAATRDTLLVCEFGNIARQEYRSIGLTLTLSPMADLATEPRWGRINGTFGEDAQLSAAITKAYILGFQGDSLNNKSVACMAKHFSGGGPQKDGEDPHFPYGKEQVYPGNNFDYHLIPFIKGAFAAHTASIMPYYGIPIDQTNENVAFAFNKEIITNLLRDSLKFDGVVCTDWNIISKSKLGEPRSWGVENLTTSQKVKKILDAGCDQFGGEDIPNEIVELVKAGQISEDRIDQSVKRILREKFKLGLFDNPYVDVDKANKIAGNNAFRAKGKLAQQKSIVLLKNKNLLPLKKGSKIYAKGITNPKAFKNYAVLVDNPKDADFILNRINTPYDKRDKYFLEGFFHQGRLYYNEEEKKEILNLIQQKPSVVVVNLERPAILIEIANKSDALLAEFGATDEVLLNILFGEVKPTGKLPFEIPLTWEAVQNQLEDMPYDSKDPLYPFGYGLTY
ncbi:glycoside hydrolase family 3 N-terminal domain-containing protein [Lutibacter sp.]